MACSSFRAAEDPRRIFQPGSRQGESWRWRVNHLAAMQRQLQAHLEATEKPRRSGVGRFQDQSRYAQTFWPRPQLMSDRLVDVEDPMVRSFAPKLLRTPFDRAVGYSPARFCLTARPRRQRAPSPA